MEGARYNLQFSGFPEQVYSTKDGLNDYAVGLRRCLIRSGQNRKKGAVVAGGERVVFSCRLLALNLYSYVEERPVAMKKGGHLPLERRLAVTNEETCMFCINRTGWHRILCR